MSTPFTKTFSVWRFMFQIRWGSKGDRLWHIRTTERGDYTHTYLFSIQRTTKADDPTFKPWVLFAGPLALKAAWIPRRRNPAI